MSENPNPTRCGNCGTENPPGQEFCLNCHAPLTLAADPGVLEGTPEEEMPGGVVVAGMGGAPIPVSGDVLDPDEDAPPRD